MPAIIQDLLDSTAPDSLFKSSAFLILAATVFLVLRPAKSENRTCSEMVPESVRRLCASDRTVTSELARDPSQHPLRIFQRLFRGQKCKKTSVSSQGESDHDAQDSLQRAYDCGRWGTAKPSTLFLKVSIQNKLTRINDTTDWIADTLWQTYLSRCSLYAGKEPDGRRLLLRR